MRFIWHQFRLNLIITKKSFFTSYLFINFFPRKITDGFFSHCPHYVIDVGLARIWKWHNLYKRHTHTLTPSGRYLTRRADSLTSLIFNVAACADFGYFLPRSNLAFSGFKGSAICRSYCCIFQIFKILTESVKNNVF